MASDLTNGIDTTPTVSGAGLLGALKVGLLILAAIIAFVGSVVAVSSWFHSDFDGTFWIGGGVVLVVLTLVRPWWFWDHPKALLARKLLTDRGAFLTYVAVAAVIISIGIRRDLAIAHARKDCLSALSVATDAHARMRTLYGRGATNLPHVDREARTITCERLLESR